MLQIKNTLGGGKPEGMYVWKKYEYIPEQTIVNPTFHIKANVSTQKATITSDDINFKAFGTLTDSNKFYQSREPEFCNFMNGFKNSNSGVNFAISTSTYSGQLELNYLNNSYWNAFTMMTPTDTGAELTASNIFQATIDDTLEYTGTKTIAAKIGEFIGYIVSDKETAYPDGGEKGGYWYEKVSEGITPEMFGCTKMAVDTFTLSSRTVCYNHTISHSLGEMPKYVFLISEAEAQVNYDVAVGIGVNLNLVTNPTGVMTAHKIGSKMEYNMNGGFYPINSTSIKFNISNSYYWMAGVKYTVITMA